MQFFFFKRHNCWQKMHNETLQINPCRYRNFNYNLEPVTNTLGCMRCMGYGWYSYVISRITFTSLRFVIHKTAIPSVSHILALVLKIKFVCANSLANSQWIRKFEVLWKEACNRQETVTHYNLAEFNDEFNSFTGCISASIYPGALFSIFGVISVRRENILLIWKLKVKVENAFSMTLRKTPGSVANVPNHKQYTSKLHLDAWWRHA